MDIGGFEQIGIELILVWVLALTSIYILSMVLRGETKISWLGFLVSLFGGLVIIFLGNIVSGYLIILWMTITVALLFPAFKKMSNLDQNRDWKLRRKVLLVISIFLGLLAFYQAYKVIYILSGY